MTGPYDPATLALLAAAAFILGTAKTSFPSAGILVVPLLTLRLQAQEALAVLMPIYVVADIVAITAYRRTVRLGTAVRLVPGALVGVAVAVVVGGMLPVEMFNRVLGAVILATVALTVVLQRRVSVPTGDSPSAADKDAPSPSLDDLKRRIPRWSVPLIGAAAGFATMIGNSGGPVVNLYLILGGLANQGFVGTASVYYLLVNAAKIPIHLWIWNSVGLEMFTVSAMVLPAAVAGTFVGRHILRRVSEGAFRAIVLVLTAAAALRLLVAAG